jgi:hypothetical protein
LDGFSTDTPREPPLGGSRMSVSPGRAAWQHKLLTVLPLVILVGAALVYGFQREPTYSSTTRLAIGRIDVNQPGALSGFAEATQALASTYSRAISADQVTSELATRFRTTQGTIRQRVVASPIPDSSSLQIIAEAPSAAESVALANAASDQLRRYVTGLQRSNPNTRRLLREFREATRAKSLAELEAASLSRRLSANETKARRRQLAQVRGDISVLAVRVGNLRDNLRAASQGQGTASLLQVLTRADSATSDRRPRLQFLLFGAVVAGALLGLALATLRANRRR